MGIQPRPTNYFPDQKKLLMLKEKLKTLVLAAFVVVAAVSCGGDDVATPTDLAGTYSASLFETSSDGNTIDQLALGATISITLVADLTMTGRIFVPGGNEDGTDFDADLAGSWTLLRNSIQMDQVADTFIRDFVWVVIPGGTLTATGVFDAVRVDVILDR